MTPHLEELVAACREQAVRLPGRDWATGERLASLVQETLARRLPAVAALPVQAVLDELVGYGLLGPLMADPAVREVMVVGGAAVYVERAGALAEAEVRFGQEEELIALMTRLVGRAGRRLDCASPCVEACLPDGTRLHAVIPPLAVGGPALTLRKPPGHGMALPDLVAAATLSEEAADFLRLCVHAGVNLLVSGPCGSGKTTLLRALAHCIGSQERVVSIEDTTELGLGGHVVALQCRPSGVEGSGAVALRELLRNALRMRPDRLIVGEVRGGEALDLLHAMSVGHACMSTLHAAGAQDALGRLETLALLGADALPLRAVRGQVGRAVEVAVHMERWLDGTRRVVEVAVVKALPGGPRAVPVFTWEPGAGFRRQAGVTLPPALVRKLTRAGLALPAWAAAPGTAAPGTAAPGSEARGREAAGTEANGSGAR